MSNLMPKRVKFRKEQRGKLKGNATRGNCRGRPLAALARLCGDASVAVADSGCCGQEGRLLNPQC